MSLIDVHTHLNMLEMTPEEALSEAKKSGVTNVITIGTCEEDMPKVMELAKKFYPVVGCTLGVHPHEAEEYTEDVEKWIRLRAGEKEVVAIGETGLDYYRNNAPKDVQIAAFESQLRIAEDFGLPVEIHTRDAEEDTAKILKEFKGRVRGLLHCFTGTWQLASVGLDCGWDISISGVVTFKNAEALRDVVRQVPLDRLHVETDAPFLAPVPFRGKKNQPAWVTRTAEAVAELKGVTLEQLSQATRANARRLFPKLPLV